MAWNKKTILLPSLAFLLLAGWFVVIYLPVQREMGDLKKRLTALTERARNEIPEVQVRSMKVVVDSLSSKLKEGLNRVYPQEKLLDLGRQIESIGGRYGLRLSSIAPDYQSLSQLKEGGKEILELPMTMEFEGEFLRFARFLDGIPEFPFVMRINEVLFEKKTEESSVLKIQLRGVIVLRKERVHEENIKVDKLTNRT